MSLIYVFAASPMQRPYDHDFDARNKVCSRLAWIDQTKWSVGSDITAEQPAFIQFFDHILFRPIFHDHQY